jgi:hypothetical protein
LNTGTAKEMEPTITVVGSLLKNTFTLQYCATHTNTYQSGVKKQFEVSRNIPITDSDDKL